MSLKPFSKSLGKPFINIDLTTLLVQLFFAQAAMPTENRF
jgi:hypothetical protein